MSGKQQLSADEIRKMQDGFMAVKGRIEGHAHNRFSFLHGEARDEAVQETLALAWQAYRKLYLEGRNPDDLVGGIAVFSVKRVFRGDALAGGNSVKDVMSHNGRRRHPVRSIRHCNDDPAHREVRDMKSKAVSPADQAAFNVDMEEWLAGLDEKDRKVALELAEGWNNSEIGARRGKSRGWTNLVRRDLRASWGEFSGERDR